MRGVARNLAGTCGVALVAVVLDQATKAWARAALAGGPAPLVPGVMDLVLVGNTGAAFSMGEGKQWLFVLLALAITVGCVVWVARERDMPLALACSLGAVVGGGIGNMIDRVATGTVTDFFATAFVDFPVFNVADIFVTCGVVAVILTWHHWDSTRS